MNYFDFILQRWENLLFSRSSAPVLKCDRCGEEIYPYELIHKIDGFIICPDCFDDFAFDYFSDCLMTGSQAMEEE